MCIIGGYLFLHCSLNQGLFGDDQVSLGIFLAFFNFGRNLHMFLDVLEPREDNKSQV